MKRPGVPAAKKMTAITSTAAEPTSLEDGPPSRSRVSDRRFSVGSSVLFSLSSLSAKAVLYSRHSGANLTFEARLPRVRAQMSNSKAPLDHKVTSGPFDFDICPTSVLQTYPNVEIGPLDLRFCAVDHFRESDAEAGALFIEHHDFSAGDDPAVDHHVDRLSNPAV